MRNDKQDIWSGFFERIDEKDYYFLTIITEHPGPQNRPDDETDNLAQESELFLEDFLKKYGLPHLYYLRRILICLMGYMVKYVIRHWQVSSKSKLDGFLKDSLKWYPELQELVSCQKIIDEIGIVKRQHTGKKVKFYMSKSATRVTSFKQEATVSGESDSKSNGGSIWRLAANSSIRYPIFPILANCMARRIVASGK